MVLVQEGCESRPRSTHDVAAGAAFHEGRRAKILVVSRLSARRSKGLFRCCRALLVQFIVQRSVIMVQPVPTGYAGVTPYLIIRGAARALDFYKKAFGATELMRFPAPGGKIGHAEMKIGDGVVMLADESPEMGHNSPQALGGTPITLMFYVADVDAQFAKALAAGGVVKQPLKDQFYGDRSGTITDPFGHIWTIATHVEDVSAEEMQRRMAALAPSGQAA
jgi:PhnB protein